MLVKVSSKGLITLPKAIRDTMGVNIGDYLSASIEDGKIIFRKVKMEVDWGAPDGIWRMEYAEKRRSESGT